MVRAGVVSTGKVKVLLHSCMFYHREKGCAGTLGLSKGGLSDMRTCQKMKLPVMTVRTVSSLQVSRFSRWLANSELDCTLTSCTRTHAHKGASWANSTCRHHLGQPQQRHVAWRFW